MRYEIAGDEVYVFTPKGEVIVLPARATWLTSPCGAMRSVTATAGEGGERAPRRPRHALEMRDIWVESTSKSDKAGPSRDWLRLSPAALASEN